MRFIQVDVDVRENLLKSDTGNMLPLITGGYYNWHRVLGGEFCFYRDVAGSLSNYDVIMVCLTSWDIKRGLVSRIREEVGYRAKIVVCPDYAVEAWGLRYPPASIEGEMLAADMVFAPHETIVSFCKTILKGRIPVELIVHPTNIDILRKHRLAERKHDLCVQVHAYDKHWYGAYIITDGLPITTHVSVPPEEQLVVDMRPYFDYIVAGTDYLTHIPYKARHKYALDTYSWIHSYGRFQVDNACLGIPTIGTTVVGSQPVLFPDLTTGPCDAYAQRQLLQRLIEDKDFYKHCVDYADAAVEWYGYDARRKEFKEKIDALTI